jgi:hypothetical protein
MLLEGRRVYRSRSRFAKFRYTPLMVGVGIGAWAGVSQALFHPTILLNYAISSGGHPADMLDWVVNRILGTSLYVSQISVDIPVPTVLGLILGASIASIVHKERGHGTGRFSFQAARNGFLVAVFVMLLGGCPIMAATNAAYGNLVMALGVLAVVAGAVMAVLYTKKRVKK